MPFNTTDATEAPLTASTPTRAEAFFQGSLDGLLVLLYMSAIMILTSELLGRPLEWWMWSLQGLSFAIFFAGLRTWMILHNKQPNNRALLLRNRWLLFLMTGVVVAAASIAMMILISSVRGSMLGLAIAGAVMALAGAVGIVRAPRTNVGQTAN